MKRKIICTVCGHRFPIEDVTLYQVQAAGSRVALVKTSPVFDACDCPKCTCQQLLQVRIPSIDQSLL